MRKPDQNNRELSRGEVALSTWHVAYGAAATKLARRAIAVTLRAPQDRTMRHKPPELCYSDNSPVCLTGGAESSLCVRHVPR